MSIKGTWIALWNESFPLAWWGLILGLNWSADFSPGRIKAVLMDLDIKNWEYYLYTCGTRGQRTHSKKEQMYFDNRASKYDATPDKFSHTYLHPSTGKDTYTQRHSKTHYPRLLADKC